MRKLLAAFLAASAVALLVVGLAAATGPASSKAASRASRTGAHAAAKKTVTIAITGDPGKLDPEQTAGAGAQQVAEFSYDTLVHQLPGGKIVSGLATKWKVLSQTKVRFTLRSGVTCSDGTKMTASVVKKNLDYIANQANGSPLIIYVPVGTKTVANNAKRTVTVTFPSAIRFRSRGSVRCTWSARRGSPTGTASSTAPTAPVRQARRGRPGEQVHVRAAQGLQLGPQGQYEQGNAGKVVLTVVTNETTAANELRPAR